MSTRSGKRIHGSLYEEETNELALKSERKTRSKRAKENNGSLDITVAKPSKRSNYVSYPSEDDGLGGIMVPQEMETDFVPVSKMNALKEQNMNISNNAEELDIVNIKKPRRQTRRTKRFAEDVQLNVENDATDIDVVEMAKGKKNKKEKKGNVEPSSGQEMEVDMPENGCHEATTVEVAIPKGKKNKKGKNNHENDPPELAQINGNEAMEVVEVVQISKGKKSKKKKGSEIVENETRKPANEEAPVSKKRLKKKKKKSNQDAKNSTLNKSSASIDSFHSAAGSPVQCDDKVIIGNVTFDQLEQEPENTNIYLENVLKDIITNKRSSVRKTPETIETLNASNAKDRRSSKRNSTFEVNNDIEVILNSTFDKDDKYCRKSSAKNCINDNTDISITKTIFNTTFEKTDDKNCTPSKLNTTFEKDTGSTRKSARLSSTFVNTTFEKSSNDKAQSLNSTFDKSLNNKPQPLNSTFDKESKINSTKDPKLSNSKSSLISSDDTSNLTYDKSNDGSRISITSDDSMAENIVNTTPVLIESSMDESQITADKTLEKNVSPEAKTVAPLKREGTFTKGSPEILSPKNNAANQLDRTPSKRTSIPSPGSTPYPFSKSSQKEKCMLNVTRSIEKAVRKSFVVELAPRTTRVMFCSPVNNPAMVMQNKRKVIKSSLKGSNKSFVFDDNDTAVRAAPRKRSYTHNDVDDVKVKRKRLADDQQHSVDRLSRPRTSTATSAVPGRPNDSVTPTKKIPTPAKSKSESKVSRTKLPNFAALHQRRFEKMESLDECQNRKAKRARQLLTPSAPVAVLERSSPRGLTEPPKPAKKPETPPKAVPTLDTLRKGYTRFGFKMNIGVNPFSVPTKPEVRSKENKPNGVLARQATQPSLVGATSSRREVAKHAVMREKSFTLTGKRDGKRKENRTVIKGVRTNRRFELQMKMRNIN